VTFWYLTELLSNIWNSWCNCMLEVFSVTNSHFLDKLQHLGPTRQIRMYMVFKTGT